MIARRCGASFVWLAVTAIISVRCPLIHAWASRTADRQTRDVETTEMPPADPFDEFDEKEILESDPCYRFAVGDKEKQEFYSPGFDDLQTYTSDVDCVRILKAPENHIITLDFRDYFEMEESPDCANDFLEVRDGRHGFNDLIMNKFCGKQFPLLLQSTDRYLWIHFKSDENIEYKGFRAVYEFIERPPSLKTPDRPPCVIVKTKPEEDVISKKEIPSHITEFTTKYSEYTDCIWIIKVNKTKKIQLQFMKFELAKPNECDKNFVQVFSTRTDLPNMKKQFCGSMADSVASDENVMFVRLFAKFNSTKDTHLEANYTAFRDAAKSTDGDKDACHEDEFSCEDATCISKSLQCNGHYNCKFKWDEDNCQSTQSLSLNDDHIIVIMVIFSLILAGMCFTFFFNCVKKLLRDHETMQEYIRQSRDQQLNDLEKQEPTEKKLTKSASRSRSNSSPSMNSGHFDVGNEDTTPCYVPGGELMSILRRNERSMSPPNGDAYHTSIYAVDDEPAMCDSACQTRESLFTTQGYSSGNSTPNHSVHTNSPPAPFSTFGYKKDAKFKAEAKIEVASGRKSGKYEDKRRPYSVQTTKSAPDVIVTH